MYDNKTLPSITQFEDLRNNSEVCTIFFDKFVQCVVGKDKFRRHCLVTPPSKFTNESDEAMTLLILSNNYEVWSEIGTLDLQGRKKHRVGDLQSKQIYFVEGHGRGRSWSDEGRKYYNLAFDMVKKDRFERGESFDQYFQASLVAEDEQTRSKKKEQRKTKARIGKERIQCRNNFSDDIMDGTLGSSQRGSTISRYDENSINGAKNATEV
jgi:hypothetical protein